MEKNRETLANAFLGQGGIEISQAMEIASDVLAFDSELARSALSWSETGVMPDWPVIAGYTPALLAKCNPPSRVYTALIMLKQDPVGGLTSLKRILPKIS